ncbi:MAG: FtsL-like putative cell division protein [Flavobacteriaceae bacterium]|jgi:hypothetical protein
MNKLIAILNLEFLIKDDALKNWRMLLFLSFLALIIIASGHSADRKIYSIAQLNAEIKEVKSEFVETRASLMRLKMETRIVRKLSDKGVGPATAPPIKLKRSN